MWDNNAALLTTALAVAGGFVGGYAGGRLGAAVGAGIGGVAGFGVSSESKVLENISDSKYSTSVRAYI